MNNDMRVTPVGDLADKVQSISLKEEEEDDYDAKRPKIESTDASCDLVAREIVKHLKPGVLVNLIRPANDEKSDEKHDKLIARILELLKENLDSKTGNE